MKIHIILTFILQLFCAEVFGLDIFDKLKQSQPLVEVQKCKAKLCILDKITASNFFLTFELKEKKIFSNLEIQLLKCFRDKDFNYAKFKVSKIEEDTEKLENIKNKAKKSGHKKEIFFGWLVRNEPIFNLISYDKYEMIFIE